MLVNCNHGIFYSESELTKYLSIFDVKLQKTWAPGFGPCYKDCGEIVDLLSSSSRDTIKKFAPHSLRDQTSIYEIEVKPVSLLEDPSLVWRAQPREVYYKVVSPKQFAGEKWWSFFMYDSEEEALAMATSRVNEEATRDARKAHIEIDQEKLTAKLSSIKIISL